jgi:hypothetical protein
MQLSLEQRSPTDAVCTAFKGVWLEGNKRLHTVHRPHLIAGVKQRLSQRDLHRERN